ncbi:MAG: phage tail sheath C-terminal domain-containing protein [Kofleriaceae bacterium]
MQLTYPGVYVTEIPSSVRPIATVSTSIAAFVDSFAMGQTDTAIQIFGMADFERIFGGVVATSSASYQIAQFFLNGGPSAWVVRVAPGGIAASVTVNDSTTHAALIATASSAGTWGNSVRLSVEPVIQNSAVSATSFNLAVTRYAGNAIVSSERFPSLTAGTLVPTINDSSQLVRLDPTVAGMPAINGTFASNPVKPPVIPPLPLLPDVLGGKTLKVTVGATSATATLVLPAGVTEGTVPLTPESIRSMLEMALRTAGQTAPTIPALVGARVTLVLDRLWIRTDPRTAGYNPNDLITIAAVGADTTTLLAFGLDAAFVNVQEYTLGLGTSVGAQVAGTAGDNGAIPDATALLGIPSAKTGMYALENADLFNILCLPAVAALTAGVTTALSDALTYCEQRRAMFIVDIPSSANTPTAVQAWVDANTNSIASANAAIYFPRVDLPDPTDGYRIKSFPNSGTIAGIWAKTDNDRGVWKAPAGIDAIMRGVAGLDYLMSDGENGVLNPLGIDCLRNFPVYGQIVWGARTLYGADARASEWKYIPIRRLALMIEESLFRGTKWVVFEPNDEPLWAKIRQNVGAFMTTLFRQGAFQGSTPDKAFFVKCDGETTTAADRNLGVVNIEVGFAPLKPAEFVVLKIQQIPDLT